MGQEGGDPPPWSALGAVLQRPQDQTPTGWHLAASRSIINWGSPGKVVRWGQLLLSGSVSQGRGLLPGKCTTSVSCCKPAMAHVPRSQVRQLGQGLVSPDTVCYLWASLPRLSEQDLASQKGQGNQCFQPPAGGGSCRMPLHGQACGAQAIVM